MRPTPILLLAALVLGSLRAGEAPAAATGRPFGNPFGLQLRPAPTNLREVREPVIVRPALSNESSMLRRSDGVLETYCVTKPASDSVSVQRSRDGGLTWSAPELVFSLPGHAYYALQVIEAADGALHAVVHVQGEGPGGYRGRLYEVYHTKRAAGGSAWSAPQRVVPGYVGSIRGFIQLARSGRLLLAVARAIPERMQPPKEGPDHGWNDTFVYFSDDQGATWQVSPDQLTLALPGPSTTRYGAIEPVLLELRDGRVWMLVRDRGGRLWQSFSADGARWSALARTDFISSDSPAALRRLRDGRIILLTNACQNWTDPRSYALGGREVLHAAISADDGRTWRGFREVFHETNLPGRGDRGTAYASLVENDAGQVVVVSGQGEGKRAIFAFAPAWLEERSQRDDLTPGPVRWTQYGSDGLHVTTADDRPAVAIPLRGQKLTGAVWNFPAASAGEIRFRGRLPVAAKAVRFALTDHFNRVDDREAPAHAVFAIKADDVGFPADGRWHELVLRWQSGDGKAAALAVIVDAKAEQTLAALRPAVFGVNYLRIESGADAGDGELLIADLSMRAP